MKPIRIVLADDHNLMRSDLKALLSGMPGVEVVAEATNGREAVEMVNSTNPDVVLMDMGMEELNGIEAAPPSSRVTGHQSYIRPPDAETGLEALSPRQREILKAIVVGRTTKQIAYDLGLSIKTIETHRTQIMERLDIHDVAGLVRFSIRIELISTHDIKYKKQLSILYI